MANQTRERITMIMKLTPQMLLAPVISMIVGAGCVTIHRDRLVHIVQPAPPADSARAINGTYRYYYFASWADTQTPQSTLEYFEEEFVDALNESGYFNTLRPGDGDDVHIDARVEAYVGGAGQAAALVGAWSLGTIPVWITTEYRAKFVVRTKDGVTRDYALDDAFTDFVWLPFIVVTPFYSPSKVMKHVLNNIYKTLIQKMQIEEILPPAKTGGGT